VGVGKREETRERECKSVRRSKRERESKSGRESVCV